MLPCQLYSNSIVVKQPPHRPCLGAYIEEILLKFPPSQHTSKEKAINTKSTDLVITRSALHTLRSLDVCIRSHVTIYDRQRLHVAVASVGHANLTINNDCPKITSENLEFALTVELIHSNPLHTYGTYHHAEIRSKRSTIVMHMIDCTCFQVKSSCHI